MSERKNVIIYTDGACSGNPGPGGWGTILMYGDIKKELSGGEPDTTNNRMELIAAIEGLNALKYSCNVDLYSDSAYLCNAFNNGWIWNWKIKGWKKSDNKPVLNIDLCEELIDLNLKHTIKFHKVKGHADNKYNNRCDELARAATEQIRTELPCDDEVLLYIYTIFENGIGSYNVTLKDGIGETDFFGEAKTDFKLCTDALISGLSSIKASRIVAIYTLSGYIYDLIKESSTNCETNNAAFTRLNDLVSTHDIRVRKITDEERDDAMIACQIKCRELQSNSISSYATKNHKLFVKLFSYACLNEKTGAWYSLISDGSTVKDKSSKHYSVTLNYLRLTAIAESLEELTDRCVVEIHTDSMYVYETATTLLKRWALANWKKANLQPVSHADIWQRIYILSHKHEIFWYREEKQSDEPHMVKCKSMASDMVK